MRFTYRRPPVMLDAGGLFVRYEWDFSPLANGTLLRGGEIGDGLKPEYVGNAYAVEIASD